MELFNLLRTDRTYATYANAEKALIRALGEMAGRVPYIIGATADGRFAPIVVGEQFLSMAHRGVTVIGKS